MLLRLNKGSVTYHVMQHTLTNVCYVNVDRYVILYTSILLCYYVMLFNMIFTLG